MDAILEKAKASEAAKKQMLCMTSGASVNAIGNREEKARGPVRKKTCFICGKKGRFARDPCPAKGRKCAKSLKYGHFASCWKGIIFRWKVVKTANRKELATAKKELEDRQTKWEVTPSRTGEESICICCSGGSTRGGVYGVDFKRVYDECEYRWFCSGSVDWFTISE